jgi:glycosyltransferase involved in cell wall biosynthesis
VERPLQTNIVMPVSQKILFIMHYPPPIHGAAMVGGYIKNSSIINNAFKCRYINLGTSYTLDEIGHGGIRKIFRYFSLIANVIKNLVNFKPDLCYLTINSYGPAFYKDFLIILILKFSGVKKVYHFHNKGISLRQEKPFDNLLYRSAFRKSYIILLSGHLYHDIQKYIPEEKIYYCPNGIEDKYFEESIMPGEKINKITQLLFLTNLIKSKGLIYLIQACKLLTDRNINFRCMITGAKGDLDHSDLQKMVFLNGLESYITITEGKYGDDKAASFASADIFVYPTFNDCMPLVLLEAMQYSLPVVSTYEGAIPELVDDGVTGFLVPSKDSEALAEKLGILIKNPELQKKMGKAGRDKYLKEFTLEKFENRMVDILEEIAGA